MPQAPLFPIHKQAIVEFVGAVTKEGGADFVQREDRIATFDQDGTLWVEHPRGGCRRHSPYHPITSFMGLFFARKICYTVFMDNPLARPEAHALIPAQIAAAGADARRRFIEFFTANIRNRNTRQAYARAVAGFFRWCEARGLAELGLLEPVHVAAYVEELGTSPRRPASSSTWRRCACCSTGWWSARWSDPTPPRWCAAPATSSNAAARRSSRPRRRISCSRASPDSLVGLRDRALIGVMVYGFARIGAALAMRVEDYFPQGKRWWLRLHEKGGKNHEMPVHHSLEAYLDAYVRAAGIGEDKKGPLFRAALAKNGGLSARPWCAAMPWR